MCLNAQSPTNWNTAGAHASRELFLFTFIVFHGESVEVHTESGWILGYREGLDEALI